MFNNLLESQKKKQTFFSGGFFSGVMHLLLVWGAVVATANAGEKLKEAKEQKVDFVEVKKEKPKEAPKDQPKMEVPVVKGFQVLTAPINIPDMIPEIDLSRAVTNEADFSGKGVQGGIANGKGIAPVEASQTYFEFQVEKPVVAAPGSSPPRYPEILKSAGVEGEVLAQFTVDTTGRADPGSFKVLKTSHELFALAVKNALPGMRFLPAEVGGRRVKQLVQQPFVFAIQK